MFIHSITVRGMADGDMESRLIAEMGKDLDVANLSLERYEGMFEKLSNVLRLENPDQ
jgi:hypothetical protein